MIFLEYIVGYTSVYISTIIVGTDCRLVKKYNGKAIQRKNSSFWRRWLTRWLITRLRTKSIEMRTYIIQALGKIGDATAFPVILNAAKDTNNAIRRFAISALGDLGDAQSIDALIMSLNDTENDIRATAAMSLGLLGDGKAENALIELLKDKDITVRSQAVIALGHLGSSQALIVLNQMMFTEANEWMRRYISQAILEIEGGFIS
jgi:HEAT repeat protein